MAVFLVLGNTSVKVEGVAGETEVVRLDEAAGRLGSRLARWRGQVAVVASVNPPAEPLIYQACQEAGLSGPLYAGRDFPVAVGLVVDNPASVGMDRILNVKAAFAHVGGACAAVDLGTAISISVCDDSGRFLGGAIMPGIGLALSSLAENTALLPETGLTVPSSPLGRSTGAAMMSGCVFGAVGAVREVISRISAVVDTNLCVFVTGGDARLVACMLPREWKIMPGLTLEGLRLAYEEAS